MLHSPFRLRFALVHACITMLLTARMLTAQGVSRPSFGLDDRVRIETRQGGLITGTVLDANRERIEMRVTRGNTTVSILLDSIRQYERGLAPNRKRAAGRGALIGGAVGLLGVAAAVNHDRHVVGDNYTPATWLAAPTAVILTLLGAGIGALSAPVRWEPPVRVSVAPSRAIDGGIKVGLTIRF